MLALALAIIHVDAWAAGPRLQIVPPVVALGIARCCVAWQLAVAVLLPLRVESCYQRLKRLLRCPDFPWDSLARAWLRWADGDEGAGGEGHDARFVHHRGEHRRDGGIHGIAA